MTKFVPREPVTTNEPVVDVDGGLPVGTHVFVLVVEDEAGNASRPARAVVRVIEGHRDPPVGDPADGGVLDPGGDVLHIPPPVRPARPVRRRTPVPPPG